MIIDCILDRYDGCAYNPRDFYYNMLRYGGYYGDNISRAMDYAGEEEIKEALKQYVLENEYKPHICNFIELCRWLEADAGKEYKEIYNILQ